MGEGDGGKQGEVLLPSSTAKQLIGNQWGEAPHSRRSWTKAEPKACNALVANSGPPPSLLYRATPAT